MKIIDKYVYNSLVLPTVFGISIFTFILMINALIEVMEKLFANDLPLLTVLDYFLYIVPGVLTQTIPMGAFLGVMLVYGGLTETNEIIAMEGSGISLLRIIRPAFIFGLILTFIGLGLEIYVNPRALKNINAQKQLILSTRPSSLTQEKVFLTNPEKGFGFYIDSINNENAEANKFILFNKRDNNPFPIIFLADKAAFEPNNLVMKDVEGYYFNTNGEREIIASYDQQQVPLSQFFDIDDQKKKSKSEMNLKELRAEYKNLIAIPEERRSALKMDIEYYQRIIGPFASVLLCWLGVLLSVGNKRSGKGISFGISLIVLFSYIGLVNYGKVVVLNNNVPTAIAMWTPNAILLALCIYLTITKTRRK